MPSVTPAPDAALLRMLDDYRRRLEELERSRFPPVAYTEGSISAGTYEGQRLDWGGSPVWGLTWREALNGGSGAWAVQGEPLIAQEWIASPTPGHPNTGSTPIFVGNGIEIPVPAAGVYWFEFDYAGYWDALAEVRVLLRVDGSSATPTSGTAVAEFYFGRADASLWPGAIYRGMSLGTFAVAAGDTVRMTINRALGSGNVYCYGGAIYCHPVELHV